LVLASMAWAAPAGAACSGTGFCFQPDRLTATPGSVVSATIVGACPTGGPVRLEFVGGAISKTTAVTADPAGGEGRFTFLIPHLPANTYELWLLCSGVPQSDLGSFEVTARPPDTATDAPPGDSGAAAQAIVLALAAILGAALWLSARRRLSPVGTDRTIRG
jgi:hypothetical protein